MKIACYCRCSTEDQKTDLQLDAIRQYAQARGLLIHREYIDFISGGAAKRPALDEMMADARRRRFDAVACWKIDRMGRSVVHLLSLLTELQGLGIAFISLQEAIDTTTPSGRMVFTFLAAIGEFERAIISERVRAGMQAARRRGKHLGRKSLGLDAERVKALKARGMSLRSIGAEMGVSYQSVANSLKFASRESLS